MSMHSVVPQPGEPATPVVPDAPVSPAVPDPGTPADPEEPATVPDPVEPATPVVPEPGPGDPSGPEPEPGEEWPGLELGGGHDDLRQLSRALLVQEMVRSLKLDQGRSSDPVPHRPS